MSGIFKQQRVDTEAQLRHFALGMVRILDTVAFGDKNEQSCRAVRSIG